MQAQSARAQAVLERVVCTRPPAAALYPEARLASHVCAPVIPSGVLFKQSCTLSFGTRRPGSGPGQLACAVYSRRCRPPFRADTECVTDPVMASARSFERLSDAQCCVSRPRGAPEKMRKVLPSRACEAPLCRCGIRLQLPDSSRQQAAGASPSSPRPARSCCEDRLHLGVARSIL
jgi:hypothetical protein